MVHGGYHRLYGFAVRKCQYGNLRSFQELLNDHCGTAFSKFGIRHHIGDCIHSLLPGLADLDNKHALAQGQAVGLDHQGKRLRLDVVQRCL